MKDKWNKFIRRESIPWGILAILLALTGLYLILHGPVMHPDSPSYKNMDPRRSAGYPFFLYIFRIFGEGHLHAASIAQIIFNLTAIAVLMRFLQKIFGLNGFLLLLFLPPLWYGMNRYYYPGEISTEALAFPIFIFVAVCFFRGILNKDYKMMLTAMIINVLLVLVRAQFLFMYPVFLLGLLHIYLTDRNAETLLRYAGILLLLYPATNLIDRSYHYAFHGKFISSPFSGNGIATNAFYIAQEEDYRLFEDETTQKLFKEIYHSIYRDTLNLDAFTDKHPSGQPRGNVSGVMHYSMSFNHILHGTMTPILQGHFQELEGIESWEAIENKVNQFSGPLIKANWKDFILYNFIYEITVRGFQSRFLLVTFVILFIASFAGLFYNNKFAILLFYCSLFHSLSFIVVAIGGRVLFRYSLYTEFLLYLLIIAGIFYLINKNNESIIFTND